MQLATQLALYHARAVELRTEADAYRLATAARYPRDFRTRLGWTLVKVGLRLAAPPKTYSRCSPAL
ncbi:hypothetical protein [Streptomyces jumonjinensis]|uniref:Uncharacterized protein n=1 Tax=Streptomyces jumonjinensis TaxID=1945 RepID=A0A646KQ06_STRJU|nr:hypothetical protein [Streptomyces jumonjinensis]MQT04404.1 hypothetical protein [Streptomyces jumonjinensis]